MAKNRKIKIKRALISVSDKTGIVDFAKKLHNLNIEIISTGGTEKLLRKNKIPVVPAEKFSGSPEMMGGRVKTLVPQIHGGILSRRKEDRDETKKHGIKEIDLVVVNLYPFEETIKKPNIELDEAIENIEKLIGRTPGPRNSPRVCDIDIIDYNQKNYSIKIKKDFLIVPHPRMSVRNFVLLPLFEICNHCLRLITGQ